MPPLAPAAPNAYARETDGHGNHHLQVGPATVFTPITNRSQLPLEGSGYEHLVLDMKAGPRAYHYFEGGQDLGWHAYEMAKDAAAFANAVGGTILIGAEEDRTTGRLIGYNNVADDDAKEEVVNAISDAVSKLCSPAPLIDQARIARGNVTILAINVWPFFGQIVGVAITGAGHSTYGGNLAYVYPMRFAERTRYLTAEQVPMFMIPETRRTFALLAAMPTTATPSSPERQAFLVWQHAGVGTTPQETWGAVRQLDPYTNALYFQALGLPGAPELVVPIDDVRQVWKGNDGRWRIRAAGAIHGPPDRYFAART